MFQRVDICLRLDRPPLPQPLTVPPSVLGNPTPNPLVNPRLSKSLQSVVADQANATLQEMLVVENFYVIGKDLGLGGKTLLCTNWFKTRVFMFALSDGVVTRPLPNQPCVTETSSISPAESSQR